MAMREFKKIYSMQLFGLSVLAFFIVGAANGCSVDSQRTPNVRSETEKLKETLASLSIGEGAYWLEILNAFGEWEPTIVVFGYADDLPVCEIIRDHAIETTPGRSFRCSAVR